MKQCHKCFLLVRDEADSCPRCHTGPKVTPPSGSHSALFQRRVTTHRVSVPVAESVLADRQPGRWPWMLILASAVTLTLPTFLVPDSVLVGRNWSGAAAEPMNANAVRDLRRSEVEQAVAALEKHRRELETQLVQATTQNLTERESWRERWRSATDNLRSRYRIYGDTSVAFVDQKAEASLYNAWLYLASMERARNERSPVGPAAEFERLGGLFDAELVKALGG